MEKIKEELKRYKWILIAGIITALLAGSIAANAHVMSFMNYQIKNDTKSIMNLITKDIKNIGRQDDWYFIKAIEYLIEENTEESLNYLEQHLAEFIPDRQYEIIQAYNNKKIVFKDHKTFMPILIERIENSIVLQYLKRMDQNVLDKELFYYFGEKPEVNETFINTMNQLLMAYPATLPLDQFQFSLYQLLTISDDAMEEKKNNIFSKLEPEAAKAYLFKELKTKPIELDLLNKWMEFLNQNKVITSNDYVAFTNIYGEIQLIRNSYKHLEEKQVDLVNAKQMIEVQIGEDLKTLDTNLGKINALKMQDAAGEMELERLTDYAHMALYIDKAYGNGEYEASIPRKNLFGNYKSSSHKYIIKLNTTDFYQEGVYYVDVYLNGTKVGNKGEEYPYYVEVSAQELERIELLNNERIGRTKELEVLTRSIAELQKTVEVIKKETGYDQKETDLQAVVVQQEELIERLDDKAVEIKNLLGIGNISMPSLS
jgi:hypothetical protein